MMLRPLAPMRKLPQQERAAFTVRALMEAAMALIEELGPDGLTMALLAQRAGVSPGTLYQYYPDREAVLASVMGELCDEMIEALQREVRAGSALALDAFISRLAREAAQLTLARRELKRAVQRQFLRLAADGGLVDASEEFVAAMEAGLKPRLALGVDALTSLCRQMVWTADGLLEGVLRSEHPVEIAEMARWLETVWTAQLQGAPRSAVRPALG
jgi:AcrR family transcriptional regulator